MVSRDVGRIFSYWTGGKSYSLKQVEKFNFFAELIFFVQKRYKKKKTR